MPPENPNIALWIANLNHPVASQADWIALVTAQLEQAAANGMDMLVIPEHISEHWTNYHPPFESEHVEGEWVMDQAAEIIPQLQAAVHATGVALLAGSSLYRDEKTGDKVNRAWALFPDRAPVYHDKCVLTPPEKESEAYNFHGGKTVTVFEWRGWKMAILICLDVEMPALSHILSEQDIDMLIVPSQTTLQAGYHRVFNCARARAIEMMAAVCVTGCVGTPVDASRGGNNGGASVFVPCEKALGSTGIFAEIPVHDQTDGAGKILYAHDIPLRKIREMRKGSAEAWPGPFPADDITVRKV